MSKELDEKLEKRRNSLESSINELEKLSEEGSATMAMFFAKDIATKMKRTKKAAFSEEQIKEQLTAAFAELKTLSSFLAPHNRMKLFTHLVYAIAEDDAEVVFYCNLLLEKHKGLKFMTTGPAPSESQFVR